MLNDLGDKYEGQDDSEYRFSDEDVHFDEVESGPPKTPGPDGGPKETLLTRLSNSRRMIFSVVVFVVLVFIVYKMVVPEAPAPQTTIAPTASQQNLTTPPSQMQVGVTAQPQMAYQPQQAAPTQVAPQMEQPMQQQQAAPQVAQPQMPPAQTMPQQQPQQTVATMPSVIPVQSPPSNYNLNQQQPTSISTTLTPTVNAATSTMATVADHSLAQFQADYAQKINEYAVQNKALQDQVSVLSARVASMESQLHQLVQALTHQMQTTEARNYQAPPPAQPHHSQGLDAKLAYSVQAIIPGRAWLRSDAGETVTVAEGDVIKDLGRVIKIDPYDGVVEVNTGTKTLSLSYGNGG